MNKSYKRQNKTIIFLLVILLDLILKSSGITILQSLELIVLFGAALSWKNFYKKQILIVILLLIFDDLITYKQIGISSIIFFGVYLILSIFNKYAAGLVNNVQYNYGVIFVLLYFIAGIFFGIRPDLLTVIMNVSAYLILESITGDRIRSNEIQI